MTVFGRSVRLPREPTVAESVAIRDAVAQALVDLGARVTRTATRGLEFHMPAPWKTGRLNPLFAVTGGELDVSAGAGAQRRIRYTLSFLRLRIYGAVSIIGVGVVGLHWRRETLLLGLGIAWLIVFLAPWTIATRRFRTFVVRSAGLVMGVKGAA